MSEPRLWQLWDSWVACFPHPVPDAVPGTRRCGDDQPAGRCKSQPCRFLARSLGELLTLSRGPQFPSRSNGTMTGPMPPAGQGAQATGPSSLVWGLRAVLARTPRARRPESRAGQADSFWKGPRASPRASLCGFAVTQTLSQVFTLPSQKKEPRIMIFMSHKILFF